MALIRWGLGSELYIYEGDNGIYTCCACLLEERTLPDKEKLKGHIIKHKEAGHSIGEAGNHLSFQSYEQLLDAVDKDDF
jgi:hypothetical protein